MNGVGWGSIVIPPDAVLADYVPMLLKKKAISMGNLPKRKKKKKKDDDGRKKSKSK